MIDDFHSDLVRNLDIDFDGIIDTIDIDQLISNYIDSLGDDDYEGYRGNATAFNNDIDDLFERSWKKFGRGREIPN